MEIKSIRLDNVWHKIVNRLPPLHGGGRSCLDMQDWDFKFIIKVHNEGKEEFDKTCRIELKLEELVELRDFINEAIESGLIKD